MNNTLKYIKQNILTLLLIIITILIILTILKIIGILIMTNNLNNYYVI